MSTPIGQTDRNRFWDQPVLCIFHPEGHVFPTKEANKNNASRMIQEMEEQNGQKSVPQLDLLAESEVDEI